MSLPRNEQERKEWIGDDWAEFSTDYLEPIYRLSLVDASKYANTHLCGDCRAQLIAVDEGDKYQIVCPKCGEVSEHTVITNHQAEDAHWGEIYGQAEITDAKPRRTEEEILKEIGF